MTETSPHDTYTSPLAARNASAAMLRIWSPRYKFQAWRRIWLAVAEAQHEATRDWDAPLVSREQVEALRAVVERGISDAEIERAAEIEREVRHDVMSHVHCLGEQCPEARPIIHLGMTSQDVVCNADLGIISSGMELLAGKAVRVIGAFAQQASVWRDLPALGFTHYQPAQPVTVGRRCALWAHDVLLAQRRLDSTRHNELRSRGLRGATGTQASFAGLLEGSDRFQGGPNAFEHEAMGLVPGGDLPDRPYFMTGQTYPRVVDTFVLADLASIASVLHKIATDIRLLSNRKELDEPFAGSQIGSSAMPYKRNPMRCERICGLTRLVMNLVGNAYDTAATQWLERTLDDSSNRRLSLPEAFLALDGALDLMHNVASGLIVNEAMVRRNLMAELPFLATENILMEAVRRGGDRQDLHERIRVHAQAAGSRVKQEGLNNDLIERLGEDPAFAPVHHLLTEDELLDPMRYVGCAPEQVDRFISEIVEPLREQYKDELGTLGGSEPRV